MRHFSFLPYLLFAPVALSFTPRIRERRGDASAGLNKRSGLEARGFEEHVKRDGQRLAARATISATSTTKTSSASTSKASSSTSSSTSKSTSTSSAAKSSSSSTKTSSSTSTVTSTPSAQALAAATSSGSCFPKYTARLRITGTGTLPKPTAFVQKSGQNLVAGGKSYRIVGPNIYWLCNDENVAPVGYYTSKTRVREALAIAVAMGANTVRLGSCGTSVGYQYALEPSLGSYGNWDIHDYVIYAAGQYGLRVILPLTDDYNYYTGGKYTFLNWRGVSTGNYGNAFYTNSQVISDYKAYIYQILTRTNTYNGLQYRNDPTILAWETGNELGAYIGEEGYPPASWTDEIVTGIKEVDANHLVIDGTDGFYNYTTKATAPGLGVSKIDFMSDHGYPRNIALLNAEEPLAASARKAFLIGEYDWTNSFGGDSLADYISAIEKTNYLGDMIWNVMGHDDQCCNFVQHNDGYSMYYPNGNTAALQANILQIVQHWYRVTGRATIPAALVSVDCPQPAF